jgi:hypothetical protein
LGDFCFDSAEPGKITIKLSGKAICFVIAALENYQRDHDRRLADDELSEDDISELENDRLYSDAIKKDFETCRDRFDT